MKRIISTLCISLLFVGISMAQAPNVFKYQSVVRDNSGNIIASQLVKFRISLLKGSSGGPVSYSEVQTLSTNQFGIANMEIGTGSNQVGNIDTIKWGQANYYMQIELDPTGSGSSYQIMGTSQLLSVPYALFAANGVTTDNIIPVGTILPFGGNVVPNGWLLCDGSAVSRTIYSNLFAVVGSAYGNGDGSTTLNVPDLRGRFLRGVDGSAGNDPNSGTRTASNTGGNTGNNVGSLQGDDFLSHYHDLRVNQGSSGTNQATTANYLASFANGQQMWTNYAGCYNNVSVQPNGGNETRPKNVYVNYIIKY